MYEYKMFNTLDSEEAEKAKDISFFKKITKVFYSPTEVFKVIKDNPSFKLVFILYVILSSIPKVLMYFDGSYKQELMNRAIAEKAVFTNSMFIVTSVVDILTILIGVCAVPLLLAFIYNLIFSIKVKTNYKKALSVILYTGLITSAGGVLLLIVNSLMGTDIVLSPFMFLDQNSISSVLTSILSQLDILNIWRIITAVYGFSVVLETSKSHAIKVSGIMIILPIVLSFIAATSVTNPIE